jgi:hypothetical protein
MSNYTSTHTGAQLDQAIEKALSLTGDNQKLKSGTTTFGSNAEIDLTASGQLVLTPNSTTNTITLTHATTHTAATAAAKKVGMDTYGHVVLGDSLTMSTTGAHTHSVSASGSITPNLSVTTRYLTASASGAAVGANGTASAITSLSISKLKTASITPAVSNGTVVPAVTVASGSRPTRTVYSSVTASKATAGTAITYGNANRATSATSVVNSVGKSSKTCYTASYDSDTACLNLSAVTFDAVGTVSTKSIYEATASTTTLTPYSFTDVTASNITSNSEVEVAKAGTAVSVAKAGTAVTYATGAVDVSDTSGASVALGVATGGTTTVLTGVKITAQPTITLTAGTTSSTEAITYVQAASGTSTSVSVSGTAASAGEHKHIIE